jgi:hypothetical protein
MALVVAGYNDLLACPPLTRNTLPMAARAGGVYLFSEGERHLYIGRAKNVRERVQYHSLPSSPDAPFAFRRAREITGRLPTYRKQDSRAVLLGDPVFRAEYEAQKRWIATLVVRYVPVSDSTNQALLEIYASDVLETPYNEYAVKSAIFSGCESHPANRSLGRKQPG